MMANTIDGSIAIAERMVDMDMDPSQIPKSMVDTTEAEPIVCASLSEQAAIIYLWSSLFSLISAIISLKAGFSSADLSRDTPSKFSDLSYGAIPIQEIR